MSEKAPKYNPNGDVSYDADVNRFRIRKNGTGGAQFFAQKNILDHYGYADRETEQAVIDNVNTNNVVSDPVEPSVSATDHDQTLRDHGYADRETEQANLSAAEERKTLRDQASGNTPGQRKPRSSGNSFAAFEHDAEEGVKQTQDDRYNALGEDHMDLRLTKEHSAEKAQLLNDRVQIMIWGSQGREVTIGTTTYDSKTPNKDGHTDRPYPGRIEQIRNAPGSVHMTEAKRNERADNYQADILALVEGKTDDEGNVIEEGGFELCQAKLIIDLREAEALADFGGSEALTDGLKTHMLKQFMRSGATMQEAKQQVAERYEGMSNEEVLKDVIKTKAILDEEELEAVLGIGSGEPEETVEPLTEPAEDAPEEDPRREELLSAVDAARDRYAEMLARSSSTMKDSHEEGRDQARQDWLDATRAIRDYAVANFAQEADALGLPDDHPFRSMDQDQLHAMLTNASTVQETWLLNEAQYRHAEQIGEAGPRGFLKIWRDGGITRKIRNKFLNKAGVVAKLGAGVGIGYGVGALVGANPASSVIAGGASFGLRSHAKRFDKLTTRTSKDVGRVGEQVYDAAQAGQVEFEDAANAAETRNKTRRLFNAGRMIGSVVLGAGVGYGANQAFEAVKDWLTGGGEEAGKAVSEGVPRPEAPQVSEVLPPQAPPTPEAIPPIEGFNDVVGNGEGITHTVQDLIRDRLGEVATPEQLGELYRINEAALDQIPNAVEMPNVIGGNGFAAPGLETYLSPELVEKLLSDYQNLR